MSKVRSDNISNRADDGAPALVYGVEVPVGYGITGAGGVNITGIATAASFSVADKIIHTGDTNTAIRFPANDTFTVETAGTEAYRVDSSQRLLVGATAAYGSDDNVAIQKTDAGARIGLQHSSTGQVTANEELGIITFYSNDGDLNPSASIVAAADLAHAAGDKPGRLVFSTTADGASSPTERLRVTSAGRFGVNTTTPNYTVDVNGEVGITEGQPITWHDGSGNPSAQIFAQSDDSLVFRNTSAGAERMRLLPAGGLTFNGDTATANALDDYEEGTWTPTNAGATVNSGTFAATGSYTKIGNIVTVQFSQTGGNISWTAGAWLISGLPFAAAIFGSVGSATDTGPSFTSSVMIWTSSQFYIQSAGSGITSLRITATYRV